MMYFFYINRLLTTLLFVRAVRSEGEAPAGFNLAIALWLWFTVLLANFAEVLAEGRSKAQAASLRGLKQITRAKKMIGSERGNQWALMQAVDLRKDNFVLVETGDAIPLDGEVIDGVAWVDESAIAGESAPVIRKSGAVFSQ